MKVELVKSSHVSGGWEGGGDRALYSIRETKDG